MFSRLAKSGLSEMFSQVSSFLDGSASSSMEPIQRSAMDDFQRINRMLPRIEAVLEDAEAREVPDRSVKFWLSELRLLAYDIDDVVDEYEYEVLRARMESGAVEEAYHCGKRKRGYDDHHDGAGRGEGRNLLVSSSSQVPAISDGMAEKLRKIRERFDEIERDRKTLRLREEDGARRSDAPQRSRPTGSLVHESSIFGREGDKKKLMEQLLSDSESSNNIAGNNKITVIPIVGMGGAGKTTLAQLIYHDPKIRDHFDLRAWIYVSEDFDLLGLTKKIYESITGESCRENVGLDQLQDSIKKELVKFKKTFLVLDDVWNEKQLLWDDFKVPFLDADIVSILTTTRNKNVADVMRTTEFFCLDSLSEEAGWQLFQQCALCDDDKLMKIGRKIVEKCGRLPLAVKLLGSHLRFKSDEDKWMSILESELWDLDPGKDEILPALRLSYQRMPIHLKPCFRYCVMFPKEKMPNKNLLVWMWIAQGYIQPKITSKTMEETGREYLDELCERSFFQVTEDKDCVTMHDLIFDLAAFISREEFIAIKSDGGDKQDKCIPNNIRHLAIHHQWTYTKDNESILYPILSTQFALRSTFYYGTGLSRIDDFQLSYTIRILHIQSVKFDSNKSKFIRSIALLKHLRYLHLDIMFNNYPEPEACDMVNLFNSFLNIYNLQVLYLNSYGCVPIKLLGSINKLINLRHLILPIDSSIPCGISKLTSLQSLKCVTVKDGGLSEIEGLESLTGSCCISMLCNVTNVESVKKASFYKKKLIWKLILNWSFSKDYDSINDVDISFEGHNIRREQSSELEEAILEALRPHNNLKELELNNYHGIRFPLWLGDPSYSMLRHMMLCKCDEWDGSCGLLDRVLPCLESISISSCAKLKKLKLVQSSSLRSLFLRDCRELSTLHGLHNLCMLKQLDIHGCRKLTTITGLQNLHSLEKLKLVQCLKLQLSSDEQLPVMYSAVEVMDCPQLKEWCQRHRFKFIEKVSKIEKHIIRGNNLDDGLLIFISLKTLCIHNVSQKHFPKYEWIPCSLNTLHLRSCEELRFFPPYQNLSVLRELIIWDCEALTHLPGIQMMEFLEKLEIINCPQFMLSPVQRLPSKLQYLLICNCPKLMWLPGLQQLLSLKDLKLYECCELMLLPPEQLPFMHQVQLEIDNCPKLKDWCRRYNLSYNKKEPLKALFIRSRHQIKSWLEEASVLFENLCVLDYDGEELITYGCPTFLLLGFYVCSSVHLKYIKFSSNFIRLKQLRIWNCPHLEKLHGQYYLTSLQDMYISNCPNLCSTFFEFPDSLQSLAIDRCNKIPFLNFVGSDLSSLEISSCSTLKGITFRQRPRASLRFRGIRHSKKRSSRSERRLEDRIFYRRQPLVFDSCNKIPSLTFLGKDLPSLEISSCSNLKSITLFAPAVSLRFLKISSCSELVLDNEFLPPMIPHLEIRACPQLQKMCQKHHGTYFQD